MQLEVGESHIDGRRENFDVPYTNRHSKVIVKDRYACNPHQVNPLRKIDPLTACLIKVLSSCGVLDSKSLNSESLKVPKASSDGTKMVHGPGSDIRTPRKEDEPNAAKAFPNFLLAEERMIQVSNKIQKASSVLHFQEESHESKRGIHRLKNCTSFWHLICIDASLWHVAIFYEMRKCFSL